TAWPDLVRVGEIVERLDACFLHCLRRSQNGFSPSAGLDQVRCETVQGPTDSQPIVAGSKASTWALSDVPGVDPPSQLILLSAAPSLANRTSLPSPPPKVSAPAPPVNVSLPEFPIKTSGPARPERVSFPSLPRTVLPAAS